MNEDRLEAEREIEALKNTKYERARLGVYAEQWLNSEVGQFVKRKAEQYQKSIMRDMIVNADLDDTKQLYALRLEYHMASKALEWIAEAVAEGRAAEHELMQLETEETLQ